MFRFLQIERWQLWSLAGALVLALLVRTPGVLWGYNFPTSWYGHHVDEYTHLVNAEMLINPAAPPRWDPNPYPKGLAAHVAVPIIALRLIQGHPFGPPPTPGIIISVGRVIGVLYGTATVLILFLFALRLFNDRRVAHLSAWILALGGLHVSQSHFFVSDVPSLFWFLLGLYLLYRELEIPDKGNLFLVTAAAACLGVSFGLKINIFAIPTLVIIALMRRPRAIRLIQAAVFFIAGFVLINFDSFTPYELFRTLTTVSSITFHPSWISNVLLYAIEFPAIVSFPVALVFVGGVFFLIKRLWDSRAQPRAVPIFLIVVLPLLLNIYFIVFKFDHFARHIVPLIPWISIVVAWTLIKLADKVGQKGLNPRWVAVPLLLYLAVFVLDGEKVFLMEPRNDAERWLLRNVPSGTAIDWPYHNWIPGYKFVDFTIERPPYIIMEMHFANHFLSGMGWKNSYPTDLSSIFAARSLAYVQGIQALFKGQTEYREVARFREGYFMPEYTLAESLIGNRSRNYVTEIVIFAETTGVSQSDTNKP